MLGSSRPVASREVYRTSKYGDRAELNEPLTNSFCRDRKDPRSTMALSSTPASEELDAIVEGGATLENRFEDRPMQGRS